MAHTAASRHDIVRGGAVRRIWAALAPVLLATACGTAASASCVGPQLVALSPDQGPALASIDLTVEWLREGCNDTNGSDEERARSDVPVFFAQQDDETLVGTVTGSGERYSATLRFQVPDTATPGSAVLSLGPEHQVIGRFTVG
jgi:hypothetical protein